MFTVESLEKSLAYSKWILMKVAQKFSTNFSRTKTCKFKKKNFQNGGIILLKAGTHRIYWHVTHLIETFADKHGVIGTVRLKLGSENNKK